MGSGSGSCSQSLQPLITHGHVDSLREAVFWVSRTMNHVGRDRQLLIQRLAGAEGATAPETLRQKDRVI